MSATSMRWKNWKPSFVAVAEEACGMLPGAPPVTALILFALKLFESSSFCSYESVAFVFIFSACSV